MEFLDREELAYYNLHVCRNCSGIGLKEFIYSLNVCGDCHGVGICTPEMNHG